MSTFVSKPEEIARLVVQMDSKTTVFVALLSLAVLTKLTTSIRSNLALRASGEGKTPPIVPYTLPVLGNMLPFGLDTESFLNHLFKTYGPNVPVRIRILNRKIYYISGIESVLALFKCSRDLTTVPASILVLEGAFGSPPSERHTYEYDNTGINPKPLEGSNLLEPNNRIWHLQHVGFHSNLLGSGLSVIATHFMTNMEKELEALEVGFDDWTDVPDLYSLVKGVVFRASTTALCGPKLFELNPDFSSDFWEFDTHVPNLFKNLPRWLIPSAFRCRDKLQASIMKWQAHANKNFDWEDDSIQKEAWEQNWGAKLMRDRYKIGQNADGLSERAIAASDLGLIWGANANIVPIIGYSLIDVLMRPDLLSRARSEILSTLELDENNNKQHLSMPKLLTQPLLQSIYTEELRLRTGVIIQRVPIIDNFQIGPWRFPKNQMIVTSAWHEQRNKDIWNEGPVDGEFHSVEEFWGERFLVDPNNPASGPRKPGTATKPRAPVRGRERDGKDSNKPIFTTDPVTGSFFPYGGGQKICPGRFYAKQEAMGAMGLFLSMFDIELERDPKAFPQPNMGYFPFGVLPPLGAFPARLRRRN